MSTPVRVLGTLRSRLYLGLGLALVVLLLCAYVLGTGAREKMQANIVPGAGVVDAAGRVSAGGPMFARGRAGGGGGMAAGRGGAGYAATEGPVASGFEEAARGNEGQGLPWPTGPMLIRTAALRVRVDDVARAHAAVVEIARQAHGYVADTTLSAEAGPSSASITIRVPSEGLESVVDRVAALGKLLQKQISAQEITEEYVDLTSRRRNLEREEQRLLDLLQRAGKVRDLLEVESTLARVRGEIETISGRLRYLENRVSLSTVRVELEGPQPKPTAGGPVWTASDVSRQALRALLADLRGLATMAIWLGIFAPFWVPLALFFTWLYRRSSAARQKAAGQ
jgi:hypothetical protein